LLIENNKKQLALTNKNALKLIDKILDDLDRNGIITNTLVADLKELRPFAVSEKRPVLAKAIRLIYEHVEEFETFAIPIPEDDDIIDEETGESLTADEGEPAGPTESLIYLMSLIKNEEHRRNKAEIREFNEALEEYAEKFGGF